MNYRIHRQSGNEYLVDLLDDYGAMVRGNVYLYAHDLDELQGLAVSAIYDAQNPPVLEEQPVLRAVSEIDTALIDLKDQIKPVVIGWLKYNPEGTREDLLGFISSTYGEIAEGMAKTLMVVYTEGAASHGYIAEPTEDALFAWIRATPVETLMEI